MALAAMLVVGLTWALETALLALRPKGLPPGRSFHFLTGNTQFLSAFPLTFQLASVSADLAGLSALLLGWLAWLRPRRTKAALATATLLQLAPHLLRIGDCVSGLLGGPASFGDLPAVLLNRALRLLPYATVLWFLWREARLVYPLRTAVGSILCAIGVSSSIAGVPSLVGFAYQAGEWPAEIVLGMVWHATNLFLLLAGILVLRQARKRWRLPLLIALASSPPFPYELYLLLTTGRRSVFDFSARLVEPIGWLVLGMVAELLLRREDEGIGTRTHLCEGCQYDLTGNVSGRCPECGQSVPSS